MPGTKVNIMTLDNNKLSINISLDNTIGDLKEEIKKIDKYTDKIIKLIFFGRVLEDKFSIKYYKINKNATITMITCAQTNIAEIDDNEQVEEVPNSLQREFSDMIANFGMFREHLGNMREGPTETQIDGDNNNVVGYFFNREQTADINELIDMGFDESNVVQIYIACERNKRDAAAILMAE